MVVVTEEAQPSPGNGQRSMFL